MLRGLKTILGNAFPNKLDDYQNNSESQSGR
jgi:hypothetical protein